jgi:hypothetical protein
MEINNMEQLIKIMVGKNEYMVRGVAKIGKGVRYQALLNGVVYSQNKNFDKVRQTMMSSVLLEQSRIDQCN